MRASSALALRTGNDRALAAELSRPCRSTIAAGLARAPTGTATPVNALRRHIQGTAGPKKLIGTSRSETIGSFDGADLNDGKDSNDRDYGNAGRDTLPTVVVNFDIAGIKPHT
jgi:hypothetical protein